MPLPLHLAYSLYFYFLIKNQKVALILNIETATSMCSVALAKEGEVLSIRESNEDKSHAKMLTVFADEVMKDQGLNFNELDAVAVSQGPGSYTGLRIGVSTAKGICFGANLPLLAIGTLTVMCNQVIRTADPQTSSVLENKNATICPMIDARRMEIYYALYNNQGMEKTKPEAVVVESGTFSSLMEQGQVIFAGSGMNKCKDLLNHPNAVFVDHILPSAASMAQLSHIAFQNNAVVNLAYFEPFYLKDFVGTVSKKHLPV